MIITLNPGEKLIVEFHESDGQFEIHFDSEEHKDAIVVKETAYLPGNVCGIGGETLYCEKFNEKKLRFREYMDRERQI